MHASPQTNTSHLHLATANDLVAKEIKYLNDSAPFVPMIRLEQSKDHYKVSIVMPPSKCRSEWISWDKGKLRLAIPAINYQNSPTKRPGFIRWVALPDDASKASPSVCYRHGCMVILVPRKGWGK